MQRTTIPALNASGTNRLPHCVATVAPIRQHADTAAPAPATPESPLATATERIRAMASAAIAARPEQLTVDAPVWGGTTITIPEPDWCNLDHHSRLDHPEDLYHSSEEVRVHVTRADGEREELMSGWLTDNLHNSGQNPYGLPGLRAAVALPTGDIEDYDENGLARLADELRAAAKMIDRLGAGLAEARLARYTEAGAR